MSRTEQGRQYRRIAVYPSHPACSRPGAGHIERRAGGIDTDHLDPPAGKQASKQAGERPRPAADVEHPPNAEPFGQLNVSVEIGAIRIQRIVELREAPIFEDRIGHMADRQKQDAIRGCRRAVMAATATAIRVRALVAIVSARTSAGLEIMPARLVSQGA
jgi:hypothetical protein